MEERHHVWGVGRASRLRQSESISCAPMDCIYSHSSVNLSPEHVPGETCPSLPSSVSPTGAGTSQIPKKSGTALDSAVVALVA